MTGKENSLCQCIYNFRVQFRYRMLTLPSCFEYMTVRVPKSRFYYLGYEYDVYISNLDTAQVAGRGNEITARIKLKVAAESS